MKFWCLSLFFSSFIMISFAKGSDSKGVTVGGTRVVFDGSKKEASLSVSNTDRNPYLIQSWVEAAENSSTSPFFITPPLFRLDSNQKNILRIVKVDSLPENKESLFWLSVKSIPSMEKNGTANTLQVAVRTRIKLIYRPKSLTGNPETFAKKLIWEKSGNKLIVTNPTPYIMNFYKVTVGGREVKDATYVLPMSRAIFTSIDNGAVSWRIISDYGGIGDENTNIN